MYWYWVEGSIGNNHCIALAANKLSRQIQATTACIESASANVDSNECCCRPWFWHFCITNRPTTNQTLLISQISTVALSVNAVTTSGDKFLQIANPLKGNNLLSGLLANSEFSKCQ
jgi:hypothetical protein